MLLLKHVNTLQPRWPLIPLLLHPNSFSFLSINCFQLPGYTGVTKSDVTMRCGFAFFSDWTLPGWLLICWLVIQVFDWWCFSGSGTHQPH